MAAGITRHHDGEADGGQHEDDRRPCGQASQQVGCATRTESCLRTLTAEGSGEIGRLTLLYQNNANKEQADNDVQNNEKNDHGSSVAFGPQLRQSPEIVD